MEELSLVAGLGNPGAQYDGTRHNVGFLLVDRLAGSWQSRWRTENKFSARLAQAQLDGKKVILCQPQTFMNASGEAVGALSRFYRLETDRILIVVDDADLPLGQIRLRPEGGCGGHHGLESIQTQIGTRAYARLRVGIGRRASDERQITNYVLGRFEADEREILDKVLERAAQQVECWVRNGIQEAMNRFNGAINAPLDKGKTE